MSDFLEDTGPDDAAPAAQDFLVGKMLIAMPSMGDPRFDRAVIFMCAHDEEHAMGVIVNKPLDDVELSELLQQLEIPPQENADETPVFFGGPVQTERGLVLHTLDYHLDGTLPLNDKIGLTASRDILIDIAGSSPKRPPPRRFLLAIGHAGWGPGQLEEEIAMNAWAHCEPDERIIFDGMNEALWKRALSKLGVTSAMLSPEWATARRDDGPLN
ncbi:YqgE/AlgH family protein [Hyphococcus formosus]|uniref:YqgE/AlgH family protein n=1 Tax=Hyphococcus formosus TaxID=3143534 RepID=UPI00398B535E